MSEDMKKKKRRGNGWTLRGKMGKKEKNTKKKE